MPTRPLDDVPLTAWERASFGMTHAVVRGLLWLLSLRGLYRFGRLFGGLEYLMDFKRRRRFQATLERALGHEPTARERRHHTAEFFKQSRCDKLFYLIFDCIPRDEALALLEINNQALLDAAYARGRGVQLAAAHHGPLHVMGLFTALKGYKSAGVREPHESAIRKYVQDRFDRLYPEYRRTQLVSSESFPRPIFRCLKEGYLIASMMDVSRIKGANQKTEEVTFFGERRPFLSGPLWIALRCRTPVLQIFVIPGENFRYRMDVVEMLIDPDEVTDQAAAVSDAIQRYAVNVERYVRERPNLISRI